MDLNSFVKGVQHIGIPTKDMKATAEFYQSLGFREIFSCKNEMGTVMFFEMSGVVFEAYESSETAGAYGAIDHVAIDVDDVESVYAEIVKGGYKVVSNGIEQLPFFKNDVRFFSIEGPNKEKVEFNQYL